MTQSWKLPDQSYDPTLCNNRTLKFFLFDPLNNIDTCLGQVTSVPEVSKRHKWINVDDDDKRYSGEIEIRDEDKDVLVVKWCFIGSPNDKAKIQTLINGNECILIIDLDNSVLFPLSPSLEALDKERAESLLKEMAETVDTQIVMKIDCSKETAVIQELTAKFMKWDQAFVVHIDDKSFYIKNELLELVSFFVKNELFDLV